MAKATTKTTTNRKAAAAAADPTKPTVTVSGGKSVPYDDKANTLAKRAERQARERGEEVATERFVVADGQSVRKGGERYMGGEAIDLTAADAERMLAKGTVRREGKAKGKDSEPTPTTQANVARSTGTIGQTAPADVDPDSDEAKAQRDADEAAAKANDEAQQAAGLPSGAENR